LVPGAKYLRVALALLLLILCACEQEPTPLPSVLPTNVPPTPTTDAEATPVPLRYAIDPYLFTYLTEADRSLITASAEILSPEQLPSQSDLGVNYDLIVVPGEPFAGLSAPTPMQISLLIDTTLSPLDDPALADIVRHAVYVPLLEHFLIPTPFPGTPTPTPSIPTNEPNTLRADLANAGYPDGFDLTLSSPFATDPGIVLLLTNALARYGIDVRLVSSGEPAHLTLTNLPTPNAIPLYTLPISYRAADGLTISFTPSGFPIVTR
jgi:hypothetical protein